MVNDTSIENAQSETESIDGEGMPDVYVLKCPIQFGEELIEELKLRPNGRAMQGFKMTFSGGSEVPDFEPYRYAELGLRLAGKPRAIVDRMAPCDQFGLGMVAMGFTVSGPGTGKKRSP